MTDYSEKTAEELEALVYGKDMDATCELAQRCLHGTRGIIKNPTRAYLLYHKGEKRQHPGAYLGLAYMYENGIYFAKSQFLANEYYKKAGVASSSNNNVDSEVDIVREQITQNLVQSMTREEASAVFINQLRQTIQQAEVLRQQSRYLDAKNVLQTIRNDILSCHNEEISQSVKDEIDRLEIDCNWLSGFVNFNEQNFTEALQYFAMNGVAALYPWSVYLSSIIHQMQKVSSNVLVEDLKCLKEIQNNQNLSPQEKGDVLGMIAEIHMTGISDLEGDSRNCAYHYYSEAVKYGNQYAEEMLENF